MKKALVFAAPLILLLALVQPVISGELPKEGTFSLTTHGTWGGKVIVLGDRVHCIYDAIGIVDNDEGKGFLNEAAFYNLGQMHGVKGIKQSETGAWEYTDADGDKVLATYEWKGVLFKASGGPFEFVAGTGKYAGITGGGESNWWPTPSAKPDITHGIMKVKGHYKLP
jgi:hypothetical protein